MSIECINYSVHRETEPHSIGFHKKECGSVFYEQKNLYSQSYNTLRIFLCTQCFEIPMYCDPLLDIVALGYHIKANQCSLEIFSKKAD